MKNETLLQRAERKGQWIEKATCHSSSKEIIADAIEKFDEANPIENCIDYSTCPYKKAGVTCQECPTHIKDDLWGAFLGVTKMKQQFEQFIKYAEKKAVENYIKSQEKKDGK